MLLLLLFFFFKQKTAYEMCGRDWSSDVCSSDLLFEHEFREGLLSMLKEIRIAIPRVHGTSHSPLVKSICSRILYNHGGV